MYKVLFRIEKLELVDKLKTKITNLKTYMEEVGKDLQIEIVFSGNVVEYFKGDYSYFKRPDLDVALCQNALNTAKMEAIFDENIRTVRAGIGEIIEKKSQGWIEFTIE
ncbi:MAG: hypothetical protein Q4E36_02695 [Bacillota bacterium]|nr:hypothetical protein [Bacillota bacterium]